MKKSGFTLIELSIVLVIIGLIVGGVLVGREMIRTAEIRATIGQLAKYNAAVNAFHEKYGGLPGDITPDAAASFGFFPGTGDGNGMITQNTTTTSGDPVFGPPYNSPAWYVGCGAEPLVFWRHLSDANLIDGSFGHGDGTVSLDPANGFVTADTNSVASFLPVARMTGGGNFAVYVSLQGQNYFIFSPISTIKQNGNCLNTSNFLSPIDAHYIDAKMDDGMPNTGSVVAGGGFISFPMASCAAVSTAFTCTVGGSILRGSFYTDPAATYNTNPSSGGNDMSCSFGARFN